MISKVDKKVVADSDISAALKAVEKKYGKTIAMSVERIYAWETDHFKSDYFLHTYSAGMVKFSSLFPFGWGNLKTFWLINEAPSYFYQGKTLTYLGFNTLAGAMLSTAEVISQRGGIAASWNSNDVKQREIYQKGLNSIKLRYVL